MRVKSKPGITEKGFFRITWQGLVINLFFVAISFLISYDLISGINKKIAGENILIALTPDATLMYRDSTDGKLFSYGSKFKYPGPSENLSVQQVDSLKKKLKINTNQGVYPEIELKGKINKKELIALLQANSNLSVENQEAFSKLYMKSHPFGETDVTHHWVFSLINPCFYFLFLLIAYQGYLKMTKAYNEGNMPDIEALEEIEQSYLNIIDVLGFSVPLMGAAILLLSVIVGPMMFINFSIPFEIKAILVLILSKTFSLVIDAIADTFREKFYQKQEKKDLNANLNGVQDTGVLTIDDSELIYEGFKVFRDELDRFKVTFGKLAKGKPLTTSEREQFKTFLGQRNIKSTMAMRGDKMDIHKGTQEPLPDSKAMDIPSGPMKSFDDTTDNEDLG